MSKLIIHADDFGETDKVTDGIVKAIEDGPVRSTSVMANMPDTDRALRLMPEYADDVSFGVHLNFCQGPSLTLAPTLTNDLGMFQSKWRLARRSLLRRLDRTELRNEIDAQIETVKQSGVLISHLDGHKHLHQLPHIFEETLSAALRHNIAGIRICEQRPFRLGKKLKAGASRVVRQILSRRARALVSNHRIRCPDRLVDIADLMAVESIADRQSILAGNNSVTELFCHPGIMEPESIATGSSDRSGELRYLVSEDFTQLLSSLDLKIANYWEI